jgi:syntaxin 7
MFLPTLGANRDRTTDFNRLRCSDPDMAIDRSVGSESSRLLSRAIPTASPLDPYFQLCADIKTDLSRVKLTYCELLRAQQQCLRPTFAEASDQIEEVNKLVASISGQLRNVQRRIALIHIASRDRPDRVRLVGNLRSALEDAYRKYSTDFRMSQQAFAASYSRQPQLEPDDAPFDIASIIPRDAVQAQLAANETVVQLGRLAQRAADVREIFAQLDDLIASQGTIVDRIDANIAQSLQNAIAAEEDVGRAAEHQPKTRLWRCAVAMAACVILLILVVVFKKKKDCCRSRSRDRGGRAEDDTLTRRLAPNQSALLRWAHGAAVLYRLDHSPQFSA